MADSVAYIKERHPEIYKNMKYKIVEISAALAKTQRARAERDGLGDVVQVINEDFFKWSGIQDTGEGSYVVALEVFVSTAMQHLRQD
jgi:SAM-dependent MidA family methyltransferase